MSVSYSINPDECLKLVTVSGTTDLKELVRLTEVYFEDPDFNIENRILVDLSGLQDASVGFRDAMTLYGLYKKRLAPFGRAIDVAIAAPSDLGYGISRMLSALTSSGTVLRVEIFSSLSDAADWLGVSDAALGQDGERRAFDV